MSKYIRCHKCKETKPTSEFYADRSKASGFCGRCKACDRKRKEYLTRRKTPERLSGNREKSRRWRMRNPDAVNAYSTVHRMASIGKIKKQPCEQCGNTTAHAHHDDYSRPLLVKWLCPKHHAEHHYGRIA